MKTGQKYVVQCHTKTAACEVGLGDGDYRKGDYITDEGTPSRKLSEAYVYTHNGPNVWEDFFEDDDKGKLAATFKPREVKVVTVIQLDEPPKTETKTKTDMVALRKKAYHPSKLTDRELAQLYRSSSTGSNLLSKVHEEMRARGLLRANPLLNYGIEIAKRISDYPETQKTPRASWKPL